jgi:hypothetical protein
VRVTIPDDLADEILQRMPTKGLLDQTVCRVLQKALPLIQEGGLALGRDEVAKLSDIVLVPSIGSGEELVKATRALHDLKIGRCQLKLEPAVLNELRARAAREGKDFGQVLQQTVDRIGQEVGVLL